MANKLGEFVHNNASNYAERRKYSYKKYTKKSILELLRNEIQTGVILGELSGAERLLKAIVDNQDWDRSDIEAELHLFISNLNNVVSEYLNSNTMVDLEDILEMYGYSSKEKE